MKSNFIVSQFENKSENCLILHKSVTKFLYFYEQIIAFLVNIYMQERVID